MKISARVTNRDHSHVVHLKTNDIEHAIAIPPRPTGFGSSVNGGELLFLALATCYCNDVYREAAKRGMRVESVQVDVEGEFGGEGEPARNIIYTAHVVAHASEPEIEALLRDTDRVAEVQNTVRQGAAVTLRLPDATHV